MTYFSRLTEIVTCNLSTLLSEAADPRAVIREIVAEMEEGVSGARRSCQTAANNQERLAAEMEAHRAQVALWTARAKDELARKNDVQARQALLRKRETEDLMAALKDQWDAASATREHLQTTLRALEARLADARRKEIELSTTGLSETHLLETQAPIGGHIGTNAMSELVDEQRAAQIEDELEALRRELDAN